ncbi:ABC transporter permease [Haliangium sp.]|uniref:ABC transporter permease n=1 Tax=Haliangium sp. TaxID=2663208 RepID=UPI003D146D68
MAPGKLSRLVLRNVLRSPRHFALSSFGIVIGIASFVFFLGLSMGVQKVVLGDLFPLDQVTVVAPRVSFMGKDMRKRLDDSLVQRIRTQPGVADAIPRMSLTFPATGQAWFEGHALNFEVGGFADGISPHYVADEAFASLFRDWEAPEHRGQPATCGPAPAYACPDPDRYYCDTRDRTCHHRVPVLVAPTLLELYNSQFASSHGLPVIGQLEQFVAMRGPLSKIRFFIGLGDTMVAGSNVTFPRDRHRQVQGMLVGISSKAIPVGVTVPIGYVERWNREFLGEEAATAYSSIIVTLADKDQVAPFAAWLQEALDLRIEDSMGERFATAIFIITTLFVLISFIIVTISAINIAHNFFMQVSERRRELGVLRAVGATRTDIAMIVLGEAALIGLSGGLLGVFLAMAAAAGVDAASAAWLPSFPFKPETYFDFPLWIPAAGLGAAMLFCVFGGFLPARAAAAMAPAQALADR